jgi:hypothetical protein
MKFSIGQAAIETGKPKSTISRAIKTGRLSATKNGNRYDIDAAELFRVFPPNVAQPQKQNDTQPSKNTNATDIEIRMLREMLDREREAVDDMRTRLTRAEMLLTDQRPKPRRWWPW